MADICSNILYSTQANDLNLLRDAKIALFYISISLVSALVVLDIIAAEQLNTNLQFKCSQKHCTYFYFL